jgi:hypothetical protein
VAFGEAAGGAGILFQNAEIHAKLVRKRIGYTPIRRHHRQG